MTSQYTHEQREKAATELLARMPFNATAGPAWMVDIAIDLLLDRTAAREQLATARELMQKCVNEITGILGIAEGEIREAIGNTNLSVLKERIAQACDFLASTES